MELSKVWSNFNKCNIEGVLLHTKNIEKILEIAKSKYFIKYLHTNITSSNYLLFNLNGWGLTNCYENL